MMACNEATFPTPPNVNTQDAQLRQELARWNVIPIGDMPQQPQALIDLGQALMFDKILSGNRDVSCATCHFPTNHLADGMPLSIGTGGVGVAPARTLGTGRRFVPRNSPSLLNQGLRSQYIFWDGRVQGLGAGPFTTPAGTQLPFGLPSILAAQAMFPVTNREEMRGDPGDTDVFGAANELAPLADTAFTAIWQAVMRRVLGIPRYQEMFAAAFPGTGIQALTFSHAAQAIAAFESSAFTRTGSPFDQYLRRNDAALTPQEKRGAIAFFTNGRCSSCHNGPLLGGSQFANTGVPQLGPGVGAAAPLDQGRAGVPQPGPGPGPIGAAFSFRVPPLRNVELTAPYMHNGAYATLDGVLKHYSDVNAALRSYDVTQLPPELRATHRGDAATINAVLSTLDFRVRTPVLPTVSDQQDVVAFLKALTDPTARDLSALVPASVPSGLPVQD
jgi:cytochrome c peroxidase